MRAEGFLLGVLASTPLDWYARCFVELQVDFHVINEFPIPPFDPIGHRQARVVEISGRLAAVDGRFADWAADGVLGEISVVLAGVIPSADPESLVEEVNRLVGAGMRVKDAC